MVSVLLYPCIVYGALLVYLFVLCVACFTVFVNYLMKQFAMCLGVVYILLLNVMDVFSVGGGTLLNRPCVDIYSCCVCDSSAHLSVPSIGFVFGFVCRKLSPHLRAGSQVFALLMLFLGVILHTMWSGKSLQLLCILPFGMLCLSVISMMFVKNMLAVCMLMSMVS